MGARCSCSIIPTNVLRSLSEDASMPEESRQALRDSAALEPVWRTLRSAHAEAFQASLLATGLANARLAGVLAPAPQVLVYDCGGTTSLPGVAVADPGHSNDPTVKRAFTSTTDVVHFYRQGFDRNSIDDAGMTLISSTHYGKLYSNAFWNGAQMVYGDGDGRVFVDFTAGDDVVCHELTHGVTQFTAGLDYSDEPGALNESVSDVFGTMFRQWRHKQTTADADWLIGADIMGPAAIAKGFRCLRDLANPGAKHCLSPQPSHYGDYVRGGDPHINSGIPNHAFYLAATAVGGRSWEKVGKVWYAALTSEKAGPSMQFHAFADLTRSAAQSLFPSDKSVYRGVNDAWDTVGVDDNR